MIARFLTVAMAAALLAGCETQPVKNAEDAAVTAVTEGRPLIKASKQSADAELFSDMVFGVLSADIASQRGDYAEAYKHYYYAARIGANGELAELATKAALAAQDKQAAAEAADYWLSLRPNHAGGLQIAALLAAEGNDLDLAATHLQRAADVIRDQGGEGYIAVARLLAKINRPELRVELMRRLAAGHEQDAEAMFALALVETGSGNHAAAEAAVRRVLDINPDWTQARVLLVRSLEARGRSRDAQATLQAFLEQDPEDDQLRAVYARLLVDQADYPGAQHEFELLLESNPEDGDSLFALAILAIQLEQTGQAENYLRRLYTLGSHRNEAAYYLGQVLEDKGEVDPAVGWYSRVEGVHRFDARVRVARILARRGDVAQAREMVRQMRGRDGVEPDRLYLVEAELLSDTGHYVAAIDVLDEALEAHPGDEDLLYTRALTAANLNRVDWLERDLNRILAKNPDHADALNALGYTLADQTDRYQEALGYIQRALALKPENAAVLDSMGWVQYRLGNHQEALRYLWRALEALPDGEIAAHLTEVLWEVGERDRALQVWRNALQQQPDSPYLQRVQQRYGLGE